MPFSAAITKCQGAESHGRQARAGRGSLRVVSARPVPRPDQGKPKTTGLKHTRKTTHASHARKRVLPPMGNFSLERIYVNFPDSSSCGRECNRLINTRVRVVDLRHVDTERSLEMPRCHGPSNVSHETPTPGFGIPAFRTAMCYCVVCDGGCVDG